MPKYAPDLTEYITKMNDGTPDNSIKDPEFLRRCLSAEAPMVLVGKVADTIEDIDSSPIIAELSKYEQGRVMSALYRREDSVRLYKQALEDCEDPETRGYILCNMATDTPDKKVAEALLRQAVEEGHKEACVHLGLFLHRNKRNDEAISYLEQGIQAGVALGVPILGEIYMLTLNGDQQTLAAANLIEMALKAGIESPEDGAFGQLEAQSYVRTKSGSVFNILGKMAPIRAAIAKAFGS
jgi:hypothetical protein